ncbi:MAG: SGNH/GDSL hydrolase family protein [Leptospira sp.]|nr:SGNH/GDSL hydrolase family protein [Leptospira sp.]
MRKIENFLILLFLSLAVSNCDTKKSYFDDITLSVFCYSFAACNGQTPARIGMIGDSWTDLLVGYPLVDTLRVQLEKNHSYNITGATLGGRTLDDAISQGLHYQVIDQTGPSVSVMLLSLGGNDLLTNVSDYYNQLDSVRTSRLNKLKAQIKNIIQTGNAYKISKYGGSPLKWVMHGYDYANINMPPLVTGLTYGCKASYVSAGFTATEAESISQSTLDAFNTMLKSITSEEPTFYYVDMRRTLGGPPASNAQYMLDCIHPNNLGFQILGNQLSTLISPITGIGQ